MVRCDICGKEFPDSEPLPEGWLTLQNNKDDYQEICLDCHQKYHPEIWTECMNCGNTDLKKSYPNFPRDTPVAYTCPKCGCQWQSPPEKQTWICTTCLKFNDNAELFQANTCTCGKGGKDREEKTDQEIINEAQETLDYNFRNEVQTNQKSIIDFTYYVVEFDGSKMAEFDTEEAAKHFVSQVEWRVTKLFDGRFQPEYWNSQKAEWIDWGEAVPAKDL